MRQFSRQLVEPNNNLDGPHLRVPHSGETIHKALLRLRLTSGAIALIITKEINAMYGGLFGDLPEAKKPLKANSEPSEPPSSTPRITQSLATTANDTAPAVSASADSSAQVSSTSKQRSQLQSSIVKNVGTLGTAVAFVPTAALKPRKRPPPPSGNSANTARSSSTPGSFLTTKETSAATRDGPDGRKSPNSDRPKETVAITSTTADADMCPQGAIHLEAVSHKSSISSLLYDEHHKQRLRQEAMDDPYDPMVPNDLLQYWERQSIAAERQRLEQQRLEHMQLQQALRDQVEQGRRELEPETSVAQPSELGRERGRGRGVSNLPAWMVAKQKQEGNLG